MRASVILCYFVYAPARVRYLVLFCNGVNQGQLSCVILYLLTLGSIILHTRHSCLVYLSCVYAHTRVSYFVLYLLTPGSVILCVVSAHSTRVSYLVLYLFIPGSYLVHAHTRVSYLVHAHTRVSYFVLSCAILCCICSYQGWLSCVVSVHTGVSYLVHAHTRVSYLVHAHTRVSYLVLYLLTPGPVILCCTCSH